MDLRLRITIDLRAVEDLCAYLGEEAIEHPTDKRGPGGEALMMDSPASNLEAWEHRYEAAEADARRRELAFVSGYGGRDYAGDQDAELHPLLVLATWEDALRDERDQPTDLRATITRAAAYIRGSLEWAFSEDENGDQRFLGVDQLSIDLRQCRAMLENLLSAGERAERSRVKCVAEDCDERPQLVRKYADAAADDHWRCPACRARYDHDEFIRALGIHLHSEAADDAWVTVADAAHSIGRPANTVRTWIKAEKVSTQITPGPPTTTYVLWTDIRDADKAARVIEIRRKARRVA